MGHSPWYTLLHAVIKWERTELTTLRREQHISIVLMLGFLHKNYDLVAALWNWAEVTNAHPLSKKQEIASVEAQGEKKSSY